MTNLIIRMYVKQVRQAHRKLKSLKDLAILTSRRLFLLKRFTLFIGKRDLHTYHVEGAANAQRWEMEKNMEPTGTIR